MSDFDRRATYFGKGDSWRTPSRTPRFQVETDSSEPSSSNEVAEQSACILESGEDITKLFSDYFNMTKDIMGREKKMLCIETHAQEIACLNHILVLKPLQHSSVMLKAFSENTLEAIHQQQLNRCIDSAIDLQWKSMPKLQQKSTSSTVSAIRLPLPLKS